MLLVPLGVGAVYRLECKRSPGRSSVFGMNRSGACMGPGRQLGLSVRTRMEKLTGSRFGTASWINCEFIQVDTFAFALSSSI